MRIGANIKTILAALAMAMVPTSCKDEKSEVLVTQSNESRSIDKNSCSCKQFKIDTKDAIALVQKTYDVCPNIPKIVSALLEGGLDQMKRECTIRVMTPIAPMLAHPIHSLNEIKDKTGDCGDEATMEWKYDGMRCQAHYDGSNIQLFSRHMLNMTDQFPDVVNCLKEAVKSKNSCDSSSFVIDAEIVGVEGQGIESRLLPFQDLSTRRKKMDDGNGIRVKVFAFDIMFLNGNSLVNEELFKRISMLHELFMETKDFSFVSSQKLITYDESKIKSFLSEAIENGAEGLMIKLLGRKSMLDANKNNTMDEKLPEGTNSFYEAGTRSHSWLKVKRDYVAGFSDTIDVVPIGAWWGSGRKAQKSFLSPILLAVYDDEEDVYRSICRCMTFTDAMYESTREFYFNGIDYPSCVDSQALHNSGDHLRQKISIGDHTILDDDNSCDDHNDENEKDGEHQRNSKNEEIDGHTNETDRVNCFPDRPSSAFVITNESPPIWFKPMEVFEVAFADLSLSRQHTAAAGLVDEEGRGVALRFPRFKRRRPDKKPEQATTSIEVAQLFAKQSKIKNGSRSFQPNRSK
jgi:DNA ligase-1